MSVSRIIIMTYPMYLGFSIDSYKNKKDVLSYSYSWLDTFWELQTNHYLPRGFFVEDSPLENPLPSPLFSSVWWSGKLDTKSRRKSYCLWDSIVCFLDKEEGEFKNKDFIKDTSQIK